LIVRKTKGLGTTLTAFRLSAIRAAVQRGHLNEPTPRQRPTHVYTSFSRYVKKHAHIEPSGLSTLSRLPGIPILGTSLFFEGEKQCNPLSKDCQAKPLFFHEKMKIFSFFSIFCKTQRFLPLLP
jgi:hypothetical protein